MMDNMLDVSNADEFEKHVLAEPLPVVVTFYADWCGDCKRLCPHLTKMADEYDGRIKFIRVEDSYRDLEAAYGVHLIPDVFLFYGGKLVSRWINVTDENAYRPTFDAFLKRHPEPAASRRGESCDVDLS